MHSIALGGKKKLLNPVLGAPGFGAVIVPFRAEITNWFEDENRISICLKRCDLMCDTWCSNCLILSSNLWYSLAS